MTAKNHNLPVLRRCGEGGARFWHKGYDGVMASEWILIAIGVVLAVALIVVLFTAYVVIAYGKHIYRIFETKPLFLIPQGSPVADTEPVTFRTADGRTLAGSYARHSNGPRRGVVLFCHEFGANRWLFDPYVGYLRESGFDVFAFDFSNQGESAPIAGYEPLQWVTSHEVDDVLAAVEYLKHRPDAPKGIGLFGVSKGGSAGLAAAARDPYVRAIITDGAFPTHGTVTLYEMRWVQIYVRLGAAYRVLPRWFYSLLTACAVHIMQHRHHVQYVSLEGALRRLKTRPWLMIHGAHDNYINREIATRFFVCTGRPVEEIWFVEKAKHNGCLKTAGDRYRAKVRDFFLRHLSEAGATTNEPVRPLGDTPTNGRVAEGDRRDRKSAMVEPPERLLPPKPETGERAVAWPDQQSHRDGEGTGPSPDIAKVAP